ncbi:PTS sugar transporter subunit IIB [Thermoflexus sp.]|uniref:PTS sugar transporter subunit IIB n=1 Tax=Thermoflexus sp. TaxID=1969742 RepID=UPI0025CFB946|nr:PTS sugar transporter subunit IIB [Thermoflexus sp.]MDW8181388.1 PTS sugar transporter subunit IIB [Anaerolineae bacterium]MCS6962630.1 PTS sugar transporter subunit IIB [Thermoflexus sp.]MCS7351929.1 PTS sugar transporter subunit IIB [Thermoflexus sp.]MCX7689988.1 PTS sugar transporter subunit IIB [Thermoflexus sp.]MDW8185785.1 PTS sugar transporter subunit IIB [Anaerolineae bacterium]
MRLIRDPLRIATVCGVGMGSSLILKMTVEDALRELGIPGRVEHMDLSSVRSAPVDVIVAQPLHTEELKGLNALVIPVTNFLDKEGIKRALVAKLREAGWIAE